MVYILGWASIYYALVLQRLSMYKGRIFVLLPLFVFAMIAFFRGSVGTDTPNYEQMLFGFLNNYEWNGQEPGFVALGLLLAKLSPSVEFAVRLVSVVFFFLIMIFLLRSDKNERYLLLLYLLPVFAYSYSMNALRVGLAFCFILLLVQFLRKKRNVIAVVLGMLAVTFHYSALIPLVFISLAWRKWLNPSSVFWAGFFAFVCGSMFIVSNEYFFGKLHAYSIYEPPSNLSGLSILFPSVILLIGVALSSLQKKDKWKLILLASVFYALAMVLTRYSYAGLRILDCLAYAFPLSVLINYSSNALKFDRVFLLSLFVAGSVSITFTYFRFLNEYGNGVAPWLPYITVNFSG